MKNLINIHLNLLWRKNMTPVNDSRYTVRFYDKDFLQDDYLGKSGFDSNGHAIITITSDDFRSFDSLSENFPDIYFVVYDEDTLIYRSKVFKDLHVEKVTSFPASDGLNYSLGTFMI